VYKDLIKRIVEEENLEWLELEKLSEEIIEYIMEEKNNIYLGKE